MPHKVLDKWIQLQHQRILLYRLVGMRISNRVPRIVNQREMSLMKMNLMPKDGNFQIFSSFFLGRRVNDIKAPHLGHADGT